MSSYAPNEIRWLVLELFDTRTSLRGNTQGAVASLCIKNDAAVVARLAVERDVARQALQQYKDGWRWYGQVVLSHTSMRLPWITKEELPSSAEEASRARAVGECHYNNNNNLTYIRSN
jgi:hypothetical protein